MKNEKTQKLVLTGVFAALSYVIFTFLQLRSRFREGTPPRFISATRSVCWAR